MSNVAQATLLMNQKSTGVALLLTFFFGPLGLFYSSVMGGDDHAAGGRHHHRLHCRHR